MLVWSPCVEEDSKCECWCSFCLYIYWLKLFLQWTNLYTLRRTVMVTTLSRIYSCRSGTSTTWTGPCKIFSGCVECTGQRQGSVWASISGKCLVSWVQGGLTVPRGKIQVIPINVTRYGYWCFGGILDCYVAGGTWVIVIYVDRLGLVLAYWTGRLKYLYLLRLKFSDYSYLLIVLLCHDNIAANFSSVFHCSPGLDSQLWWVI